MKGIISIAALLVVLASAHQGAQAAAGKTKLRADAELTQVRLLAEKGDYEASFAKARSLVEPFEEQFGSGSRELADLFDRFLFAWLQRNTDGTPQMLALAQRTLAMREALVPPDDPSLAESLRHLAVVLWARKPKEVAWSEHRERSLSAVGHQRRALQVQQVGRWKDDPQAMNDFDALARMLVWGVGTEAAIREGAGLFDEMIEIHEQRRGRHHGSLTRPLHGRASARWRLGEFDGALADYERALEIARQEHGARSPQAVSMINSLANTLALSGEYGEALTLHEHALAIEESTTDEGWKGRRSWWIANTLNSLGRLHYDLGLLHEARALLERGAAIEGHVESIELNLGRVLHALGEYDRARQLFEASLVQLPDGSWTCTALGDLLVEMGQPAQAVEFYERAIASVDRDHGPEHFYKLDALKGLAQLRAEEGKLEQAEALLRQALAIAERTFGAKSPRVAEMLAELARLHMRAGDAPRALDEALRAESLSRDHLRLTSRSLAEREALRFGAARTSTMDLLLELAVQAPAAAPDAGFRIWDALVQSRALVLDEMAARRMAVESTSNPAVKELEHLLTAARARLARLVVLGPGGQEAELHRELVERATAEKDRAEKELAARSARFNRDLSRAGVGLADALEGLPPRGMLVGYGRHDTEQGSRYLAFVGANGKPPIVVPLGPAGRIDELVTRWRSAILSSAAGSESSRAAQLAAGTALREAIWDPLARALDGAERVIVTPDGTLGLVNLAALPAAEGGYVLEHGPLVQLVSAERDLALAPAEPAGRGLLAMGAPDYGALPAAQTIPLPGRKSSTTAQAADAPDAGAPPAAETIPLPGRKPSTTAQAALAVTRGGSAACPVYADLTFAPLPQTKAETDEIASVWATRVDASAREARKDDDVVCLSGTEASEATFKRLAPGRRVVHVATHGFFLGEGCSSALARTRGIGGLVDSENRPQAATPGESPLLLAGLAFAAANRRFDSAAEAEDGILTAEEIAGIDLSSADWVVLSGCETGVGTIDAGEGVLGLRRAVQIAGGRTLIMSLWPVEDEAAREWMERLYRARWIDGLDTPQAVRAASLGVLHARRDAGRPDPPFFWGAFVAAGRP